jgi:predicted enzyme related to lactoylglutathione lyase
LKPSHIHLNTTDLKSSLRWLENVWQTKPVFANEKMAVIEFGDISYVLDASDYDSNATIAYEVSDCDVSFAKCVENGAEVLREPENLPWGVRAAYFSGPGGFTFELEQRIDEK